MKNLVVLSAVLALTISSCGNSGNTAKPVDSAPVTESGLTLQEKQAKAAFILETTEDSMGTPHTSASVEFNDSRAALPVMICSATLYNKEQYAGMDIPADAIAACGGWYAGGGDYYYIVPTPTGIAVYQGYEDEGQEDAGYHWEKIKEMN